jgi:FkbM family methyltransferase
MLKIEGEFIQSCMTLFNKLLYFLRLKKTPLIKVLSIGWFTKNDIIKLLRFRNNIHIVAYDPCQEVLQEYKSIESSRLKVEGEAVEAGRGIRKLFIDSSNRGATSTKRGPLENTVDVSTLTLSDVIAKHGEFDYVYINCEGSEIPIILNTPLEVLLQCAVLFVQFHKFLGLVSESEIEQCINKLKTHFNYKVIEERYPNYKFVQKGYRESIRFRFIK